MTIKGSAWDTIRVLHHDFFGSAKKEGEPLHINGGIEADGKAVGLMQHPPGARGKPIHIYRFAPCTGDLFFKDLIIKCLENKK
ncbi:hypothetical protein DW680_19105 [Parabacteroides distasonis]|nr:hypothetical protein DW680_19105 [Parabacteroides distasonis]